MPDDNIIQFRSRGKSATNQKTHKYHPPPMLNIPPATKFLSLLLIAIFLFIWGLSHTILPAAEVLATTFGGFVPARWTGQEPFPWWTPLSLLSFSLLHAGWLHLGTNILMLVAIGSGLERAVGLRKYAIVYLICTLFGAMSHLAFTPFSPIPIIGASGGISGLFGAMLTLMHKSSAFNAYGERSKFMPIIAIYIAITVFAGFLGAPDGSPIAWAAHIGGFLSGIGIMMTLLKQRR